MSNWLLEYAEKGFSKHDLYRMFDGALDNSLENSYDTATQKLLHIKELKQNLDEAFKHIDKNKA